MSLLIALLIAATIGALLYLAPHIKYILMACRVGGAIHSQACDPSDLVKNSRGYYELRVENKRYGLEPRSVPCEIFVEEMAASLGQEFGAVDSGVLIGEQTTVFRFKNPANPLYF